MKMTLKEAKKLSPTILLKEINKMKKKIKSNHVWKEICQKYNLETDELDYVPMAFANLDVSAKCDHGVIYFNYKLLCDGFENNYSYALHELTHFADQTAGDKPTKSSDDGNYLDNKYEQKAFQNQVEYIADQFGEEKAEEYVDDLLEHHEIDSKTEMEEKKDILMNKIK